MQRKDVERLATELDRQDEYAPLGHVGWEAAAALRALLAERDALQGQLNDLRNGWAKSVKAHAALLAERDAAFAAGQEEMRGRAGKAVLRALYKPVGSATEAERHMDDNMVARGVYEAIRDLPIKPRP